MDIDVIVVAGGHNGMAAATYLARAGLRVAIFERRPFVGGAAITDGCIWHIQHNGEQLFWNRPLQDLAHYRAPLAGLYLCGAGQRPGGEVSGQPGHNAAHEILRDLKGSGP
jgi:phytoene dehydrogenase-like protein